jgi:hypothetical protein
MSEDDYWVTIDETLVGREAGGSARQKARELRAVDPLRTMRDRVLRRHSDERACSKGATGERWVGWLLAALPNDWYVFNDIPVGERGTNIDHLAIGRGGVFTVNTKNLSGAVVVTSRTFRVDGYRAMHLPVAVHEAQRAARLLSGALDRVITVHPILAVIAPELVVKEPPTDVFVGSPRTVKRWLLGRPAALSSDETRAIQAVAAKPGTWRPTPAASPGVEQDHRRGCRCGGELVLRHRKTDGAPFLGCSNFPRCRRTQQIG